MTVSARYLDALPFEEAAKEPRSPGAADWRDEYGREPQPRRAESLHPRAAGRHVKRPGHDLLPEARQAAPRT